MTTSAARTTSSVRGFGYSPATGTPISSSAVDDRTAQLTRGFRAGGADVHAVAAQMPEDRRGHLRAAGVLHAHEQHLGNLGCRMRGVTGERVEAIGGELRGRRGQVPVGPGPGRRAGRSSRARTARPSPCRTCRDTARSGRARRGRSPRHRAPAEPAGPASRRCGRRARGRASTRPCARRAMRSTSPSSSRAFMWWLTVGWRRPSSSAVDPTCTRPSGLSIMRRRILARVGSASTRSWAASVATSIDRSLCAAGPPGAGQQQLEAPESRVRRTNRRRRGSSSTRRSRGARARPGWPPRCRRPATR